MGLQRDHALKLFLYSNRLKGLNNSDLGIVWLNMHGKDGGFWVGIVLLGFGGLECGRFDDVGSFGFEKSTVCFVRV